MTITHQLSLLSTNFLNTLVPILNQTRAKVKMTPCFFSPSIIESICPPSKGFAGISDSPSFDTAFGLRYLPDDKSAVNWAENAWYVVGGRGDRGDDVRRIIARAMARLSLSFIFTRRCQDR